jgi:hypothetical protein
LSDRADLEISSPASAWDLIITKLAAGRLKDYEFLAAVLMALDEVREPGWL